MLLKNDKIVVWKTFLQILYLTISVFTQINGKVCLTKECVLSAADLINSMNHSANPCEDFYTFACGKWQESNAHTASMSTRLTEMTRVVHLRLKNLLESHLNKSEPLHWMKSQYFYRTCLNSEFREKFDKRLFLKDIDTLGGWPVLESDCWDEECFDWVDTLGNMFKMGYNKNIFFSITTAADLKNTSIKRIYLDHPMFGMGRQFFNNRKILEGYLHFISEVVILLRPNLNSKGIIKEIESAVDIERHLAEMAQSTNNRRNASELYNLVTIAQMMDAMPEVNWLKLINKFLPDTELSIRDEVVIKEPEFLTKFSRYVGSLNRERKRDLANYMFYRLAISTAADLPKLFRWIYYDFKSLLVGLEIHPPLWSICVRSTRFVFSYSISSIYLRNFFRNETRIAVSDMVGRIQGRLISILQHVKWMDDETRKKALKKAHHMTTIIGHADDLLDDKMLNEHYANVKLTHSHYRNIQRARAFQYRQMMKGLQRPVNKSSVRGHINILMANAYYSPSMNTMNIPVAILQRVMFHEKNPNYINYGRLGSIVGHELTHAFDDKGAWYDEHGNWNLWWANDTYEKFKNSSDCLVKQYNKFYFPQLHVHLNGTRSLGENIADNCGVRESYLAYQKWVSDHHTVELSLPGLNYTANQLFWIAYASGWCSSYSLGHLRNRVLFDVHPPARNRILATVSNSKEFAKDFNCPKNATLNPPVKCTVWI